MGRTRAEIDGEYSQVAKHYGDRVFKGAMLQEEIKALHNKMSELARELASDEVPRISPADVALARTVADKMRVEAAEKHLQEAPAAVAD